MSGRGVRRFGVAMVALLLAVGAITACSSSRVSVNGDIEIATGGRQGVYYAYGVGLADQLSSVLDGGSARVISTGGSVENLDRIAQGTAQFAFVAADAAVGAVNQANSLAGRKVRAVARLYDDYIHVVVPNDSPVTSVADLRGRKVAVGAAGSQVSLVSSRLLHAAGLTPAVDVTTVSAGLDQSIDQLASGTIDAFFWSGGLPTNGITALAATRPIRLLALGELADSLQRDFGNTYRRALIPAGTYAGVPAVSALAVSNYLVTSVDTDDALVARVAAVLYDARTKIAVSAPIAASFDRRAAIFTAPVKLHPGAEQYYRSVKP